MGRCKGKTAPCCSLKPVIDSVQVGLIGVSENWLSDAGLSSASDTPDKFAQWQSDIETATTLAQQLRDQGAQLVLVLCHSNARHTKPLARVPGVDFVLGGHEHIKAPDDPASERWLVSTVSHSALYCSE